MDINEQKLNFQRLVEVIQKVHIELSSNAKKAINISLTLRNWLIGCYLSEYKLSEADRAKYGEQLLAKLAKELRDISNCNQRQLYRYLRFYRFYPQIVGSLPPQFEKHLPQTLECRKVGTVSPQLQASGDILLQHLSYSHIDQLVDIDDETKRLFYEVECIRSNWSVRELKRQVGSLYYERSGLSLNKNKLSSLVDSVAERSDYKLAIRDPYVFEFLGLKPKEVMSENHLEDQLIGKIQEFLLEMGHGFCFESRQKRILIGGEHFFVDLVFCHHVLKFHIL